MTVKPGGNASSTCGLGRGRCPAGAAPCNHTTHLHQISERYGPVFTVHLGPRRIVVLCGHEAVKEALVDQAEEFSGRGEQATFDRLFKGYGEGDWGEGVGVLVRDV